MAESYYGLTNPQPVGSTVLGRVRPGPGNTWAVVTPDQYNEEEQSAEILREGRQLAQQGVPLQVSSLLSAVQQLRARAAGSTAEILPDIVGQLSQLRAQYAGASQAIARRLGYAGGGQTERQQAGTLGQAVRQYGGAITQQQQAGMASLINLLGGIQPQIAGAARPPSVSTRDPGETPGANFQPSIYGRALQNLLSTGRVIYDYYQGPRADAANAANTIAGYRQEGFTQGLVSNPAYSAPSTYTGPPMDEFGYSGISGGDYYYGYGS
jgi:hypothetical protein